MSDQSDRTEWVRKAKAGDAIPADAIREYGLDRWFSFVPADQDGRMFVAFFDQADVRGK